MKTDLQLYKYSFLNPLLHDVRISNSAMRQLKSRHHLDHFRNADNTYLSTYSTHLLIQDVWMIKSSSTFLTKHGGSYHCNLHPEFEDIEYISNKLEERLKLFVERCTHLKSNIQMCAYSRDTTLNLSFRFPDERTLGKYILEQIWLLMCMTTLKHLIGDSWTLKELHVPYKSIDGLLPLLPKKWFVVRYEQSDYRLIFQQEGTYMEHGLPPFSFHAKDLPEARTLRKIEKVLMSYESGYRPTLRDIAIHFGLSSRTIKRILKSEETNFTQLIDSSIFYRAIDQLAMQDLTIEEVSENLGFSDGSNFIRSFKRWTGISPGVFRTTFLAN